MRWSSLGPAFLGGIAAGIGLHYLRSEHLAILWPIGALLILAGLVVVFVATRPRPMDREPAASPRFDPEAAPPLGQMLIKYGLISQSDLDNALRRQKDCKKRLGRVLVDMGLVTYEQVAQVLEEQLSRRENRLLWGRGQMLVR
jgi:hypothetical protein